MSPAQLIGVAGDPSAALRPASFHELSNSAQRLGFGVLIGWRRQAKGKLELNPGRKRVPFEWSDVDELVTLMGQSTGG